MPTTTELVTLDLIPGSDIGDPNTEAAAVLKDSIHTISQQDGFQALQFGLHHENPQKLQMFINWDTIGHHHNFMASDGYTPFLKRFQTIFEGKPEIVHVDFKPDGGLAAALSAPVTEVATFYFNDGPPDNAIEGVEKALKALEAERGPLLGWAYGTTHETIEKDDVKGKGTVLAIGWKSVEDHMEARKTQAFKDNIDYLRNGAKGIEVHHVPAMNYQG